MQQLLFFSWFFVIFLGMRTSRDVWHRTLSFGKHKLKFCHLEFFLKRYLKDTSSNSAEDFWGWGGTQPTISLNRQTSNFYITLEQYLKLKPMETTCLHVGLFNRSAWLQREISAPCRNTFLKLHLRWKKLQDEKWQHCVILVWCFGVLYTKQIQFSFLYFIWRVIRQLWICWWFSCWYLHLSFFSLWTTTIPVPSSYK